MLFKYKKIFLNQTEEMYGKKFKTYMPKIKPPKKVKTKTTSRLTLLYIMEIITTSCRFFRSIRERFLKYISFKTIDY
jgi:hypothetical protein